MSSLFLAEYSQRHLEESRDNSVLDTLMDDEDAEDETDLFSAILSNAFLFFLIFGLSATVDVRNLRHQLQNRFAIACGVLMQFLIMPFLGFLSVMVMREAGITKAMGIALLVVTASPGGSYSNWWCSLFNAELALSVAMTTVSSILSIGLLPANLLLYTYLAYGAADDESILEALDFKTLFITLGIVLTAILTGLLAGYHYDSPQFHVAANRFGSVCGLLLILFSVFLSSGGGGSDSTFWTMEWSFYLAVAFPCLVGITLANFISRSVNLTPPETVAIAIECCYQNTGIATSVAITMFDDKDERAQAVAVPLFYGLVEAVVIGIYCLLAWKWGWTKAPADENICVILGKTYEVAAGHDDDDDDHDSDEHDEDSSQHDAKEDSEAPRLFKEDDANVSQARLQQDEGPPRQGFFGWVWSVFFGRPQRQDTASTRSLSDNDETPKKNSDKEDGNRSRFVSADYTAETSQCSSVVSPMTPETPPSPTQRDQVIFNIATLTIPEAPSELSENRSDSSS